MSIAGRKDSIVRFLEGDPERKEGSRNEEREQGKIGRKERKG